MSAGTAPASPPLRVRCRRCEVAYRPERTDGECPICREPAPGHRGRDGRADDDLDVRSMIVIGMSALNLLVLAVLGAMLFS